MSERQLPNRSDASSASDPSDSELAEIRRLAGRRRLLGRRIRRVLPSLVVGSATLTGTGALAAWVGHQPGIHTVTAAAASTPTTVDPLGPLAQQLQADEKEVGDMQTALANLQKQRASQAAQTGGAKPAGGSPVTIAPLPAIPSVSINPAPVVNATTGASHAIP